MKLFRKPKPAEAARTVGRRRHSELSSIDTQALVRPNQTLTSYSAQRSNILNNNGHRDQSEVTTGRAVLPTISPNKRRLAGFGIVLLMFGGLYMLSLNTKPHIVLLQDGTTAYFLRDAAVYQQTTQQTLSRSIFNRNKLTIDTAAVRLSILNKYPEVRNVSVALPIFGHAPQVYIEPYKPSFVLTTSSNAFLLDATGRALASTNNIPQVSKLGLATIQDHTGVDVRLGSRAIPSTTVTFTQTVVAALRAAKVIPSALVLPPGAYELDVSISGAPYYVKFNLQNDALEQAGTYLASVQNLTAKHLTPGQYIDVRVPGRAYYK